MVSNLSSQHLVPDDETCRRMYGPRITFIGRSHDDPGCQTARPRDSCGNGGGGRVTEIRGRPREMTCDL